MLNIYEIDSDYISYLSGFEEHIFKNRKISQNFSRKYVGVVLNINGFDYFAPLSSFKEKHKRLSETTDFIKIGVYAVINLNNMFPAPLELCKQINFNEIEDLNYKNLLRNEYRIIRKKAALILQNASAVYKHRLLNDGKSKLSQRCNNFKLLEEKSKEYKAE